MSQIKLKKKEVYLGNILLIIIPVQIVKILISLKNSMTMIPVVRSRKERHTLLITGCCRPKAYNSNGGL